MAGFHACNVLVTGANRGLGLELVKQFLEKSNPPERVFAACRNPEGAQELKYLASKHPNLVIILLDVTNLASIEAAVARVEENLKGSGLNLLINNAAILRLTTLESETRENMSAVYTTNVTGPLLVSQAFLPLLKKAAQQSTQKGLSCSRAAIVNMSSEAGSIKNLLIWDFGHFISYRCSKAALNMLTKCQSLCYAEQGILTITFHPGWVKTDMGSSISDQAPLTPDESVRGILNTLPMLSEKDNGAFVDWKGNHLPW
ncbi:C-signal isoform X1 [Alligator mississippiensis]|uniref:C-factor-like n=1 Tax=Alligator mississippiensis TaxID=8496 RepID=A0A151NJZ8_ALLMI|nr:C-signal isoform X1 [Alligator mississippiensis]KYO37009.1 C-factor-like [Alligator mississippiensis]